MLRFDRYNFEGYHNLFTYTFTKGIYIIQGDYNHNMFNSIFNREKKVYGNMYLEGVLVEDLTKFTRLSSSIIFEKNNFIEFLDFYDNVKMLKKARSGLAVDYDRLSTVLKALDIDESIFHSYSEGKDYVLDMKLALSRAIILSGNIVFVILDNRGSHQELNIEFVNAVLKASEILNKIIIINDADRHLVNIDAKFIKYFQGYISEKII